MANRIQVVIDLAVDKATNAVKGFRQSITDADGAVGKFKAGASSALASVQANAGQLAIAGGAALVAFGAKAVAEFQNVALEAGRLSQALGLTAEEASRYIEVAGDLGISSSSLEAVLGKMNQTAGKTPQAFDRIGASIKRNADGTTNVNQTFLATVDALNQIEDPFKRAAAAQQIFGRSWRDSAELIGMSSRDIRKSLAEVSDQKVIDDAEVEKARRFRAAMDELNDAVQDVSLALGESLVPVLTDVAETITQVRDGVGLLDEKLGPLDEGLGWINDRANDLLNPFSRVTDALDKLSEATEDTDQANRDAATSIYGTSQALIDQSIETAKAQQASEDFASAYVEHADGMRRETNRLADEAAADLQRLQDKWDEFTGALDDRSAFLDIEDSFDDLHEKGVAAFDGSKESAREHERAVIDLKQRVFDYITTVGNIPPEKITEIQTLLDQGQYNEVERQLRALERVRIAQVAVRAGGISTYTGSGNQSSGSRSHDGSVVGGQSFKGLRPDEVPAILQKGQTVLTPAQLGAVMGSGGGGPVINVTVNAGLGTDGNLVARQIVDTVNAYFRNGGPGFIR